MVIIGCSCGYPITVSTPDGNIVSNVIQQGDCNAPATYQALMNYLFSAYLGRFMDVYLDDDTVATVLRTYYTLFAVYTIS